MGDRDQPERCVDCDDRWVVAIVCQREDDTPQRLELVVEQENLVGSSVAPDLQPSRSCRLMIGWRPAPERSASFGMTQRSGLAANGDHWP
jgi:hypothetical protein